MPTGRISALPLGNRLRIRHLRAPILALLTCLVQTVPQAQPAPAAHSPVSAFQGPTEAYRLDAVWLSLPGDIPDEALSDPWGVAVDPFDGAVLVVDSGNNRVQVFDTGGVRSLGGRPDEEGALSAPTDVAVQGSVAFVTDTGNGRVAVFDLETGAFVTAWPDLDAPWGIAASPDGRIAVVESGTSRVAVFRADGRRLGGWPVAATALRGVAFTAAGQVAVADSGAGRIRLFAPDGAEVRTSADLPGAPVDVDVDPNGDFFVTLQGASVVRLRDQFDLPLTQSWPLSGAAGIATGPAPDLAVVASFRDDGRPLHGVQHWRGRPLVDDGQWGQVPAPLGRLDAPYRVAAGEAVLVADAWRRIQRFQADGSVIDQLPAGALNDLAAGPAGDVLVAKDASVSRVRPDGSTAWEWMVPASQGQYAWVVAVAYAPDLGRIFAIDIGHQRMWTLSEAGAETARPNLRVGTVATPLWDLTLAGGQLFSVNRRANSVERRGVGGAVQAAWEVPGGPLRVAGAPDGTLFVLNRHGWIWKYTPTGQLLAVWRAGQADASARPFDLTVDDNGRVLVVDRALGRVEVYVPDPLGDPGGVPSFEPTCSAIGDKVAEPTRLSLGQDTSITLTVGGGCGAAESLSDIVLAIDVSGSMSAPAVGSGTSKMEAAKAAALTFLDVLDFGPHRVGVVAFDQAATLVAPLSDTILLPRTAILGLQAAGGTNIAAAVDAARTELTGPRGRTDATPVIVLMTDGFSDPVTAQRAADQANLEGVRLFTIGFGEQVNEALLLGMATTPADYYLAPTAADLQAIYENVARRIAASVLFRSLTVTDELPPNMDYVAGSGSPEPEIAERTLVWRLADVPMAGLALTYRVRPTQTGTWPTNVVAVGDGIDGLGQPGRVPFPVPQVEVVAPSGTPPPTATATATPTPRPTATPGAIYLPLALKQVCQVRRQHVDVVLVLDTSGSMLLPTTGHRTKLEAAVAAATGFIDLLDMNPGDAASDGVAVVAFNDDAFLVSNLTASRQEAVAALNALPQGPGTRIDSGLITARVALAGDARRIDNLPVVVLLTDGLPTSSGPEAVLEAAHQLRIAGVIIYAIGLGADVDALLLQAVAGDADRLVLTPDGEDLAAIYTAIARDLPCVVVP